MITEILTTTFCCDKCDYRTREEKPLEKVFNDHHLQPSLPEGWVMDSSGGSRTYAYHRDELLCKGCNLKQDKALLKG